MLLILQTRQNFNKLEFPENKTAILKAHGTKVAILSSFNKYSLIHFY